jgi:hypothetical protein
LSFTPISFVSVQINANELDCKFRPSFG